MKYIKKLELSDKMSIISCLFIVFLLCHPEFISGSYHFVILLKTGKMLKQVQHDNFNYSNISKDLFSIPFI